MDSIREVFAHRLRELRGGLTQDEFSERLGIPKSSYQKMEAGNVPQKNTLAHLVKRLRLESETALFLDPDLSARPPAPSFRSRLLEIVATFDEDQSKALLPEAEAIEAALRKPAPLKSKPLKLNKGEGGSR